MSNIILHQFEISPLCGKIRKVLALKKVEYVTINYQGFQMFSSAKLTKPGKLPVLEDKGEKIFDSTAIARYLDKHFSEPPLFPADPYERALVNFLEDWSDESLYWYETYFRAAYPEALEKTIQYALRGRSKFEKKLFHFLGPKIYNHRLRMQGLGNYDKQQIESQFFEHLTHLDNLLAETGWLVGKNITLADLAISAELDEIMRTSTIAQKIKEFSNLQKWLARTQIDNLNQQE